MFAGTQGLKQCVHYLCTKRMAESVTDRWLFANPYHSVSSVYLYVKSLLALFGYDCAYQGATGSDLFRDTDNRGNQ